MLLQGHGAAGRIPQLETAFHKLLVRQPFVKRPAFHRQGVAEAVDHEDRLGMNKIGHLGLDLWDTRNHDPPSEDDSHTSATWDTPAGCPPMKSWRPNSYTNTLL